ncbi:hypothetical protein BZG36_05381 [Bifiguratus adelaidae]|uniref:ubiquitinyl hydrolase 1 n=1 Tax=Bifiguratus adelaidae TaxID=1938954 RepID=A0A261XTE5_9FUNG|nr:hypothetical protein BZG36_05381 [Bifiguratus adelaidae]
MPTKARRKARKASRARRASNASSVKSPRSAGVPGVESSDSGEEPETAENEQAPFVKCPHTQSVKVHKVKKALPHLKGKPLTCTACPYTVPPTAAKSKVKANDEKAVVAAANVQKDTNIETAVETSKNPFESTKWICLTCAKIHCGRDGAKHALEHYETTKDHFLAANLETFDCWCYKCDADITPTGNKNQVIAECQATLTAAFKPKNTRKGDKTAFDLKKWPSTKVNYKVLEPGLQNLGHTCFFNSTIQAISATTLLYATYGTSATAIPVITPTDATPQLQQLPYLKDGSIPHVGPLNTAFRKLLNEMWTQNGGVINPSGLFSQISKKWKQYRRMQEQDAQELMRYLLDGMRMEEIDYIKKHLQTNESEEKSDEGAKNAEKVKPVPILDMIFGGKLVSIIVCDHCKEISLSFEDFMDLSLPISNTDDQAKEVAESVRKMFSFSQFHARHKEAARRMGSFLKRSLSPARSDNEGPNSPQLTKTTSQSPASVDRFISAPVSPTKSPLLTPLDTLSDIKASYFPSLPNGFFRKSVSDDESMDPDDPKESSSSALRVSSQRPQAGRAASFGNAIVERLSSLSLSDRDARRRPSSPLQTDQHQGHNIDISSDEGVNRLTDNAHESDEDRQLKATVNAKSLSAESIKMPTLTVSSQLAQDDTKAKTLLQKDQLERIQRLLADVSSSKSNRNEQLSILDCLHAFTSVEILDGLDKFACENCWRKENPEEAKVWDEEQKEEGSEAGEESADELTKTSDRKEEDDGASPLPPTVVEYEEGPPSGTDSSSNNADRSDHASSHHHSDSSASSIHSMADTVDTKTTAQTSLDDHTEKKLDAKPSTHKPRYILRRAFKRYLVASPPQVLVLHLKRFQQVNLRGTMRKIDDWIEFPETVNMDQYVALPEDIADTNKSEGEDLGQPDGVSSREITLSQGGSNNYRLYGVVVQTGSLQSGHYGAYIYTHRVSDKDARDKSSEEDGVQCKREWVYCSDTSTRAASLGEVLSQKGYILFYERVN